MKKRSAEVSAYKVNVNITGFDSRRSSLKERVQGEYLRRFWVQGGLDNKQVSGSKEDRLSGLTTRQIDQIIDMQKIRSLLYDRKIKKTDTFLSLPHGSERHTNVYQASFLARVNQIAIKRDIRSDDIQGFDQIVVKKLSNNHKGKQKPPKGPITPYKFAKEYRSEKHKLDASQRQEEKSISSISDDLQQFQGKLSFAHSQSQIKQILPRKERPCRPQIKFLPTNRWFYGMSTFYLQQQDSQKPLANEETFRGNFDIQQQVKEMRRINTACFPNKGKPNATHSTAASASSNREILRRSRVSNLTTLKTQ